jgi:predicted NBD/HSP70 family sugar kinase
MYLGVDVGGTKTLVAVFDRAGTIRESAKIPTSQRYSTFLKDLEEILAGFSHKEFRAAGVAIPASRIDRTAGVGISFGNLKWRNVPIQADLEKLANCPVVVENDAKAASLSEALLRENYRKVLYITISTGIGYGMTVDGHIDSHISDGGGASMSAEYRGKRVAWESFASARAIYERYGKKVADITDEGTWKRIAHDLSGGFSELVAITEPDIIVVGGPVGTYFERLKPHLIRKLEDTVLPTVKLPRLMKAKRPEEAVVYGCYELAKAVYGNR